MANTYTQLYIQIVFAVKRRQSLIDKSWKDELYKYITGIVQSYKHKMIAINGMPDHLHNFIGYNPNQKIPDLVEEMKTGSNAFIKKKGFTQIPFEWQIGYGAFSYARSAIPSVTRYIENQENHHRKVTFQEEYIQLLNKFDVDFDDRYVFDFFNIPSW